MARGLGRRTTIRALAVAAAVALAAVGCRSSSNSETSAAPTDETSLPPGQLAGMATTPPQAKPSFVLTDTAGQPYDFAAETAGKLTVLYFGYTNCPDICQTTMSQIAAALSRDGTPPATVVFVTVDPARDTPDVLRSWLDHFDSGFVGLTGTPAAVGAAQQAAKVPQATRQPGGTDDNYFMSHPGAVLIFAPDGLGYTRYDLSTSVSEYQHDLGILADRTTPA